MVFVVDSTDIERLTTASEELSAMLNEDELKDAALLVFANKQDQPGSKGAGDISEALKLGELRDRNWSIMACSAVDGRGVNEGMDWLVVSSEGISCRRVIADFGSKQYKARQLEFSTRSDIQKLACRCNHVGTRRGATVLRDPLAM